MGDQAMAWVNGGPRRGHRRNAGADDSYAWSAGSCVHGERWGGGRPEGCAEPVSLSRTAAGRGLFRAVVSRSRIRDRDSRPGDVLRRSWRPVGILGWLVRWISAAIGDPRFPNPQ